MCKYLYGASVQGIQPFIFQTNKLKEIAGASELVEQICNEQFAIAIGKNQEELENDVNTILTAAGNIKYLFPSKEECEKLVLEFPKQIMEFAPGITISQAVVKVDGFLNKTDIDYLEKKLRTQRNKAMRPYDLGSMAIMRSRDTGLPAFKTVNNEFVDLGALKKQRAIIVKNSNNQEVEKYGRLVENFFGNKPEIPLALDLKHLAKTKSKEYSWIAVIHADGNNMGLILQKIAKAFENNTANYTKKLRSFSLKIDKSTKDAAQKTYKSFQKKVVEEQIKHNKLFVDKKVPFEYEIPFRPIVIGGDDLTIICRADLALKFTQLFLENFENETKQNFADLGIDALKSGLTACAGIAFIKESFPFHYGISLAESLCTEAKNIAKKNLGEDAMTPSCLMFHKVQDSFVESLSEIKDRELKIRNIRLDYGPYFLNKRENYMTIKWLIDSVNHFEGKEGNAVKSHLRQWLTDMHDNSELAKQKLKRLRSVAKGKTEKILEELDLPNIAIKDCKSPIYDWLTIHSINQGGN